MTLDPLRNKLDPLHKSGPEGEQALFRLMSDACNGFPLELAVGASANILVNAIRQQHATKRGAEDALDRLTARLKVLLLDGHYDSMGHRRNVFPFHQVVEMPLIDLRSKH